MSISAIVTRGYGRGIKFIPTRGYLSGTPTPTPAIIGGHFLPDHHKKKRTLSNVLTIYNKAKELPRKETKELRDSIAKFVPADIAMIATVPEIHKVDYEALALNDAAYERFAVAIENIQKRLEIAEAQERDDSDLMEFAFIASLIH